MTRLIPAAISVSSVMLTGCATLVCALGSVEYSSRYCGPQENLIGGWDGGEWRVCIASLEHWGMDQELVACARRGELLDPFTQRLIVRMTRRSPDAPIAFKRSSESRFPHVPLGFSRSEASPVYDSPIAFSSSADSLAASLREQLSKKCRTVDVEVGDLQSEPRGDVQESVLLEWETSDCLVESHAVHAVGRSLYGRYSLFQIVYQAKTRELAREHRDEWIKALSEATIVFVPDP